MNRFPNKTALALGAGLALYGIHWQEQPLLEYFFLPQIGLVVMVGALMFHFGRQYYAKSRPNIGPRVVWVPMLVIITSLTLRAIFYPSLLALAGAFYGLILFAIYVAVRDLDKDVFLVFILFVAIVALSIVVSGIENPGKITGGIITNYCAAAGFLVFGTVVSRFKWQWVLVTIALVALFFVGSLEAVFVLIVLGIFLLLRKDYSHRLLLPVGAIVVLLAVWLSLGYLVPLYTGNNNIVALYNTLFGNTHLSSEIMDNITTDRWSVIVTAVNNIKVLGHGYVPGQANWYTVHNIPLVIMDQIGPAAAVAWTVVTLYCLLKTKWKYAWVTVLAVSVFDHYLWTQFAPYWWVLAGTSTASGTGNDLIFKKT